jgi:hypothetical protein
VLILPKIMPEDNEQTGQQESSDSCDKSGSVSNESLPLNETPPAPPEKTTEANFTESCEGIVVFVQAEGESDRQDDE